MTPSPSSSASQPGTLAQRLEQVRARIARACEAAGRSPGEVTLVAVTKYAPPEQIRELVTLGVADLGESRVQQLQQRAAQINEWHARQLARAADASRPLPPKLRWHMIGHLQRNKVKTLLPLVSCIHSVDSLRLAEELDSTAGKLMPGKKVPVLMQVNASEEPQKFGVAVGAAVHLAEQIATMPNLQLIGLMTMAAYDATESEARFTFSRTRELFEEMKWHRIGGTAFKHLSMGMSGDFEWAIAEGATMVRIGSQLFGGSHEHESQQEDD
ncbi:MAG: YggS family pyridoxal phosphate-dependent enzyme [Tepidisphaerales bacterium]